MRFTVEGIADWFTKKYFGTTIRELISDIQRIISDIQRIDDSIVHLGDDVKNIKKHIARTSELPAHFSPEEYLEMNPDVKVAGVDPVEHYLEYGAKEGRRYSLLANTYRELELLRTTVCCLAETVSSMGNKVVVGESDKTCLISIITPVYNRDYTIAAAIKSVINQTYENWEMIIVSDGSTDKTVEVIRKYIEKESRIKLFEIERSGASKARNFALDKANGDIIVYLDSDNRLFPNYLEVIDKVYRDNKLNMAYGIVIGKDAFYDNNILWRDWSREALLAGNYIDMNSFSHRKQVYDKLGGFDERLTRFVDWDLILKYTANEAPVKVKTLSAFYSTDAGGRISDTEGLEKNIKLIQEKILGKREDKCE